MFSSRFLDRLALLATIVITSPPRAVSDPVGVYGVIDRVVLQPDTINPRTIQIWGVFALAEGERGDNYGRAERGYLYYSVNARNERATRAEWSDLRSVAGTGRTIGFGQRYQPNGRVRRGGETPANPDLYPLGFGLVKVMTNPLTPSIQRELASVPAPLSPAEGATVDAGTARLVARNVADPAVRYVFEIESSGVEPERSGPIPGGRGETSWSPRLRLRPGASYTWRVWVENGNWKGSSATSTFRTR